MSEERTRQFNRGYSLRVVYTDGITNGGNPVVALAEVYQGSTLVARYFGRRANRRGKNLIRWLDGTCDTPSLWYLQHVTH